MPKHELVARGQEIVDDAHTVPLDVYGIPKVLASGGAPRSTDDVMVDELAGAAGCAPPLTSSGRRKPCNTLRDSNDKSDRRATAEVYKRGDASMEALPFA